MASLVGSASADIPQTICGITARAPAEFRIKVEAEAAAGVFKKVDAGARFDLFTFTGGDFPFRQWAFSKPDEPSYPMATCREVFKTKNGDVMQARAMNCEASRTACLAVLAEFQQVDTQAAAELRGK